MDLEARMDRIERLLLTTIRLTGVVKENPPEGWDAALARLKEDFFELKQEVLSRV